MLVTDFSTEFKLSRKSDEKIRNVELALSAVPWGAISMMKLVTEKASISQANYVGFIKWLNTGFVKLENPSGKCLNSLVQQTHTLDWCIVESSLQLSVHWTPAICRSMRKIVSLNEFQTQK